MPNDTNKNRMKRQVGAALVVALLAVPLLENSAHARPDVTTSQVPYMETAIGGAALATTAAPASYVKYVKYAYKGVKYVVGAGLAAYYMYLKQVEKASSPDVAPALSAID